MICFGSLTIGLQVWNSVLDGSAKKAHIIDGRIPHSLVLEIYTDKGIGTQIIK